MYQRSSGFLSRTFVVLNAKIDIAKTNVEHLPDVNFNDLLEAEYSNLAFTPLLHKTGSMATANILFSTQDIHLRNGKILGFLEL